MLATGDTDGGVQLWDTATGWQTRALAGYTTPVRALAFSSDDRSLAGGDVEGTVKVWDLSTGRVQRSFMQAQFAREQTQTGN
jgi:WD40 repeat protein